MTDIPLAEAYAVADAFVKHCRRRGVSQSGYAKEWESWTFTQRIGERKADAFWLYVLEAAKQLAAATDQPDLDVETLDMFALPDEPEWDYPAKFLAFHEKNPHVYVEIVNLCREAKSRGRNRWGMKGVFEVLRWKGAFQTTGDSGFKLSNNYHAWYARLVTEREPDLQGFFVIRENSGHVPMTEEG